MSTLLDIVASLPSEALVEGATLGVITHDGQEFVITFGKPVPTEAIPALLPFFEPHTQT